MEDAEIDVRAVLGVLRRQLRLIIAVTLTVIVLVGIVTFTLKPVYTATALVLVDTSSKNLLDPEIQFAAGGDNARVESEVELVRSDAVLLRVIDALDLVSDPAFAPRLGLRQRIQAFLRIGTVTLPTGAEARAAVLASLRSMVEARRRGLTYLISIEAQSGDREQAARIANAVARNYIEAQVAAKVDSALLARDVLAARLDDARREIASSDETFDAYLDANLERIQRVSGNTSLAALRLQIEDLREIRSTNASTAKIVAARLSGGSLRGIADLLASEALAELERQRDEIVASVSGAAEGSQTAIDLRAQLAAIDRQLEEQARVQLGSLEAGIAQVQAQEDALRLQLRSTIINSSLPADVLTEIYGLQQSAQLAREQYQALASRAQDLDAQVSLQIADSRIVSPALAPASASFPNTRLILLLAGMIGLVLGVGLAFLYENYVGGFTSEEQAQDVLRMPVIAAVPRLQSAAADALSPADVVSSAPLSAFAEAIRRARATLDYVSRRTRPKPVCEVIVVTSTLPGEGKTTVALSLARSYAQAGKRTLLIDGDLRRPNVHRALGLQPEHGLLDFLESHEADVDTKSVVRKDPLSDAVVILGARDSTIPTDRIVSADGFNRVISLARKTYDVVVVDTPPLLPVVDGLYIAQLADALIFVLRWASTSQTDARKSLDTLRAAVDPDVPILTVLNQQEQTRGAAYQYRYGNYYGEPA